MGLYPKTRSKEFNLLEEVRIAELGAVLMLSFIVTSFIILSGQGGITGAAVGTAGNSSNALASLTGIIGGSLLFSIIILVYIIMIKNIRAKSRNRV